MGGREILVRPVEAHDLPEVARVRVASWREGYAGLVPDAELVAIGEPDRLDRWVERACTDGSTSWLVATDDERIVGFSAFGAERSELAPAVAGRGEIYALYVHPDHWRTGAGTALVHATSDELVERGYEAMSLWVLEGNARGIAFYERSGFRRTGEVTESRLDALPEIRMARDLWLRPDVVHPPR